MALSSFDRGFIFNLTIFVGLVRVLSFTVLVDIALSAGLPVMALVPSDLFRFLDDRAWVGLFSNRITPSSTDDFGNITFRNLIMRASSSFLLCLAIISIVFRN